ncbi:MAG: glutaminyl-peptide cyclotransferase [bacterium]|nr:glutaminyl-peptide cyclotransferase [bacterium]
MVAPVRTIIAPGAAPGQAVVRAADPAYNEGNHEESHARPSPGHLPVRRGAGRRRLHPGLRPRQPAAGHRGAGGRAVGVGRARRHADPVGAGERPRGPAADLRLDRDARRFPRRRRRGRRRLGRARAGRTLHRDGAHRRRARRDRGRAGADGDRPCRGPGGGGRGGVRPAAGQDTVRAVLRVQGPPSLVVETPQPSFGLIGGRLAVLVRNGGGGSLGWTAAVTTGGAWAAAAPAAGAVTTGTDTVWVTADRAGLAPGTHYCSLVVTPTAGGARTIPLRAYVAAEPARGVRVLATHPHDPGAFTQGLAWDRGALVEGTGHYGESELRRVELATGEVLQSVALAANEFGEGVAVVRDRVLQLTWQNRRAYVRDLTTFAPLDTFLYNGEGWGLAWDGARLVMSDGSSALVFRDPDTFAETGRVTVTTGGAELERLNELECAGGLVWANVWLTDFIARIDPASGAVVDWLDLTGLLTREQELAADVLNGIAVDGVSGRIFVTGKFWPSVFEIEVLD